MNNFFLWYPKDGGHINGAHGFQISWIHSWELRVVIAVDVRSSVNMKTSTMISTLCFFFILSSFFQFSDAFVSNQVGRRSSKVGIEYFLFHLWEIVLSMATFSTGKMDFSELCLKFGGITFTSEQWDLLYKQYFPPYYKLFFDYWFTGSLAITSVSDLRWIYQYGSNNLP